MTKFDPEDRIGLEDVFQHPWVLSYKETEFGNFKKEMMERVKQVSEHYRKLAFQELGDLKISKEAYNSHISGWEVPEQLEEYLSCLKPKLQRLQSHFDECSENCSSESSSVDDSKSKVYAPSLLTPNHPKLRKTKSSNSSSEYSSDSDGNH